MSGPETAVSATPRAPMMVLDALRGGARIAVWSVLTVTALLGSWVGFGWSFGGWTPVTVTSGSMAPALQVGDVLLVSDEEVGTVGQRSIVVFERDERLIAHRVAALEGDLLVTKGDANATNDVEPVPTEDVVGVARLVVPRIGLPAVWTVEGQWWWFGGWLVLVAVGLGQLVLGVARTVAAPKRRDPTTRRDRRHEVGRRGIQRVRVVVAVLVGIQHFIERDAGATLGLGRVTMTVTAIVVLLATNVLGVIGERHGHERARSLALAELGIDTALVVLLTMWSGSGGSSWVLLSLPIIEAAVRFRLVGALVHWMLLTTLSAATTIWRGAGEPAAILLADLDRVVDQLSVLFLVVVPGAYLAEQLIGEVRTWQDATSLAEDRGQLLVKVADLSRDISRLDGAHLDHILEGVRSLGFDACDIVVDDGDGGWRIAGGDALPAPGTPASCLQPDHLAGAGAYVDAADPDPGEAAGLERAGLAAVVAQVVSVHEDRRVVLRAGLGDGRALTGELVEAFRLLAGHASVALRNDQLLAELTSMHAELEHQALHDVLTGLPNRALLLQRLERLQGTTVRPALLFLDLDGFKPVNDRLGHDAGDVILQRVADRLVATAPPGATVARLGGDEFTVLLPACPDDEPALELSRAIGDEISRPFDLEQGLVGIGTSIGIAFGGDGIAPSELIRRADVAMYQAKHRSRRAHEVYRPEFDGEADRRELLLRDIVAAIGRGEVGLEFQPIFDLATGARPIGAEALVRWHHPVAGAVSSRDIVDTARAAGALSRLTEHVLLGACRTAARWREASSGARCFVAVNVSLDQLRDGPFDELVQRALRNSGLAPDLLHIEVGEQVIASTEPRVTSALAALRTAGVRLVLDEVGRSGVSLSSLHVVPLAGIKLDRGLVVNAMRADADRMVLRSVVELSRGLGHLVIAGGIESDAQVDLLREVGCTVAQGYHLAVPHAAQVIEALLGAAATSVTAVLPPPSPHAATPSALPPPAAHAPDAPVLALGVAGGSRPTDGSGG